MAVEFGYVGMKQIYDWKEIYRKKGPDGLMSITKGRKPEMTKKDSTKKQNETTEEKLKRLEEESLELRIKNKALKLLASMKQQTKKSQK